MPYILQHYIQNTNLEQYDHINAKFKKHNIQLLVITIFKMQSYHLWRKQLSKNTCSIKKIIQVIWFFSYPLTNFEIYSLFLKYFPSTSSREDLYLKKAMKCVFKFFSRLLFLFKI